MSARIQGLMEARRAFARIPEIVRNAINDVHDVTAREIVRVAQSKVPVRTGLLRRHIAYSIDKRRGTAKVGVEQGAAFYGHFLEFGTVRQPARPFMMPAVEGERNNLEARFKAAGRAIEREASNVGGRFV